MEYMLYKCKILPEGHTIAIYNSTCDFYEGSISLKLFFFCYRNIIIGFCDEKHCNVMKTTIKIPIHAGKNCVKTQLELCVFI